MSLYHPTLRRRVTDWQLRTRSLRLGERTQVMGIVNITPDSFSDGGFYLRPDRAIEHALRLLDEGADILDLGAESTRPGSQAGMLDPAVSGQQEQSRLLPVIEGILQARPDAVISVDTYKSATACAAVAAGAEIVNDVSGLGWDPLMATAGAELGCGMVLMHTRGTPEEWRAQPPLDPDRLLPMVMTGLGTSLRMATDAGILRERIVLDPGYGFGKRFDENYVLLARQAELLVLGHPLLAGLSRKSFLTRTLSSAGGTGSRIGHEAIERASLAALVTAILQGASILRVHAVREAVEAAAIADAVLRNL